VRAGAAAARLRPRAAAGGEPAPGADHLPGDATVFFTRPLSLTLLVLAAAAFVVAVLPAVRRKREVVFEEED
jgi:hypothetical protein